MLAVAVASSVAAPSSAYPAANIAKAWGFNKDGELGNRTTESSAVPVDVSGLHGVTAIAGGSRHSLALLQSGAVMAWGENFYGQLGDGTNASSDVPIEVGGLTEAAAVATGESHSLALLEDGPVMAWGANASGQLGNGGTSNSEVPVRASGLSEVQAISAGGSFSLALMRSGTVMAWGDNSHGQLGDGTKEDSDVPHAVSRLSGVVAISAGFRHSLALLSNGTVVAWGDNEYGQLGDGTETERDVPVPVRKLSGVSTISAGTSHSLALVANGAVMAWGDDEEGQLGDGTHGGPEQCGAPPVFACSRSPVRVRGLVEVTSISAGVHSLALLGNGAVMAWGPNDAGQLGDGSSAGPETCTPSMRPCSTVPVRVSAHGIVLGISTGGPFSLAFGPPLGPLPQLGRCVKVARSGAYRSSRCLALSATHRGHFEWLPGPGPKAKFNEHLSEPQLETVGRRKLVCVSALLEGEYTGPKSENISHLTLEGCRDVTSNRSCQTDTLGEGLVESSVSLEGELGFLASAKRPRVGWDLKPKPPATALGSFKCGAGISAAAVALEGSVIGRAAPIDRMVSAFELLYSQSGGRQIPAFLEGEASEVLTLSTTPIIGAPTSEPVGLKSTSARAGEEPLEIKAKM